MLAPEWRFQHLPSVLDRGHYVLGVRVYADNAEAAIAYIDLAFPGRFAELGDDRSAGPLGGVETSLRKEPPEAYAVDKHPVNEREPVEHPQLMQLMKAAQPEPHGGGGPKASAPIETPAAVPVKTNALAVDVVIHPNVGAGCTPGAHIRGVGRDPVEARSAKFILTDVLLWDDELGQFIRTSDTHPAGDFREMTLTGSADLFRGETVDFGFIAVENGRLRIPGHREGQDDCRMGRPGVWRLSGRVVAADGRHRDVQVCFKWDGEYSIPKPIPSPDANA